MNSMVLNPPDRAGRPQAPDSRPQRQLDPLAGFFDPKIVAVIGASDREGTVGRAVIENLGVFGGAVYPVNWRHATVLGIKAYPRVGLLPESPDLVVIATPAPTVPAIVRECVHAGVGAAIVLSAGFKECGAEGAKLEHEILGIARDGRLRIIGPNCLGLMAPHAALNATFARSLAEPGSIAFLSQSGALCTAILDWSFRENVGFSGFVSLGSMLDIGWGDLIYHFGDDPLTKSIVCYMESVGDARSFLSAAREVALSKPVIVLKVGRTEPAARAAASHTGALTGSDAVVDAAFKRVGVLRVASLGELFDVAEVLAKQPRTHGPRLAIVTNAGGPGALATDALIASGGKLAQLEPPSLQALNGVLPSHWSCQNPVDVLGDADPARYRKAIEIVGNQSQTDGILAVLTPQSMTRPKETAEALALYSKKCSKPILASWMGGNSLDEAKAILNKANIPTFEMPDTAARVFALMWKHTESLHALYETPSTIPADSNEKGARAQTRDVIDKARAAGRTLLSEVESKQILAACGIPTVITKLALTETEAVELAEEIGFPVVAKLHATGITHKSDLGGVRLDLRQEKEVRQAWRDIRQNIEASCPGRFVGLTIQQMINHQGIELIVGSCTDPQFGPVLMFGSGGKLVEAIEDIAVGLPPLNVTLALRLMEQTKVWAALEHPRSRKPVDLRGLATLLARFSELVAVERRISEMEINPLLVTDAGMMALDARIVLHSWEIPDEKLPRLAIRPYPHQYVTKCHLANGTQLSIRPIRPEDEPLMVRFHQTLSDQSVYFRYFTHFKLDQRVAHERLSRLCFIDYDREMALIAERCDPLGAEPEIVGVGRLTKLHGIDAAEFALLVSDRWQGQGIGGQLLRRLVQIGRDCKLKRITGLILPDNSVMQKLARKVGFKLLHRPGECVAEMFL